MPAPEVLYLDNHLLVVSKPAGMLTQSDHTGDLDVAGWAKGYLKARFDKPGNVFAALVHRLDRPASGVLVLARTSKAASRLSEQFRSRTVEKTYLAVVEGALPGGGTAEDWLLKTHSRESGTRVRVVAPEASGAKRARLAWRSVAAHEGRTLVEVELETGRAHQIRVQLAHRGHPIVGDLRYGARAPFGGGRAVALHARRLRIEHPTQRDRRLFLAPPPEAWTRAFPWVAQAV